MSDKFFIDEGPKKNMKYPLKVIYCDGYYRNIILYNGMS